MQPTQEAKVVIKATDAISNLFVTIHACPELAGILASMGMDKEFDLAYPGDLKGQLTEFGFPLENDVIGKTEVTFDITQFVPLLGIYPGQNTFIIRVVDQKGNEKSQDLKFE